MIIDVKVLTVSHTHYMYILCSTNATELAQAKQYILLESNGLNDPFQKQLDALKAVEEFFRAFLGISNESNGMNSRNNVIYCSQPVFAKVCIESY